MLCRDKEYIEDDCMEIDIVRDRIFEVELFDRRSGTGMYAMRCDADNESLKLNV